MYAHLITLSYHFFKFKAANVQLLTETHERKRLAIGSAYFLFMFQCKAANLLGSRFTALLTLPLNNHHMNFLCFL